MTNWDSIEIRDAERYALQHHQAIEAKDWVKNKDKKWWLLSFSGFYPVSWIGGDWWIHTGSGIDAYAWACTPETVLYTTEAAHTLRGMKDRNEQYKKLSSAGNESIKKVCDLIDAEVLTDVVDENDKPVPVYSLGWHAEHAAGLLGGELTPYFKSLNLLNEYCQQRMQDFEEAAKEDGIDWDRLEQKLRKNAGQKKADGARTVIGDFLILKVARKTYAFYEYCETISAAVRVAIDAADIKINDGTYAKLDLDSPDDVYTEEDVKYRLINDEEIAGESGVASLFELEYEAVWDSGYWNITIEGDGPVPGISNFDVLEKEDASEATLTTIVGRNYAALCELKA